MLPLLHAFEDQIEVPREMHELNALRIRNRCGAVRLLQRRACDHAVFSPGERCLDMRADCGEPRRTIGIVEWKAGTHLRNVRWWMKIVRVAKTPAELFCQFGANGRLAATRDAHEQHDDRFAQLPCPAGDGVATFVEVYKVEH